MKPCQCGADACIGADRLRLEEGYTCIRLLGLAALRTEWELTADLTQLRDEFDAMLIAEVTRYGVVPAYTVYLADFRNALSEFFEKWIDGRHYDTTNRPAEENTGRGPAAGPRGSADGTGQTTPAGD